MCCCLLLGDRLGRLKLNELLLDYADTAALRPLDALLVLFWIPLDHDTIASIISRLVLTTVALRVANHVLMVHGELLNLSLFILLPELADGCWPILLYLKLIRFLMVMQGWWRRYLVSSQLQH